ncbi:MAG TPA: MlaD family protein [Pseudonocardiaceae bacterium]|jgi:phospholipid/cholesterol/gamma-HCH transport system substrate-binding protein|nr:MlaD family protein [Pseudonocardiaceae bacterium]
MTSRTVRWQLLAFLLVTVLGLSYVSVCYLGAGTLLGTGRYSVTLQSPVSGGIVTGSDVTYRGVSVGRVGALRLTRDGVEVQLDIRGDAPPIPADLDAAVRNLSVIGEQFVDLRPVTTHGPMLADGAVIPASRVSTPVPVEDLVLHVDDLARSVPVDSLRTVVDELGTALGGTGHDLALLLDTSDAFTRDTLAALPQALALIRDGRVVLTTQRDQADAIVSFSRDLALLAEQLRAADPDLRRLIRSAPQAAAQTSGLLAESGPQLGALAADLLAVSRVAAPRQDGLRQILATYPVVAAMTDSSILPGDGFVHLGIVLNFFDPPPCVRGYEGTRRRSGTDTTPAPVNTAAHCAEPPGSPINVRGAQNAPRPGVPVSPRQLTTLASILES